MPMRLLALFSILALLLSGCATSSTGTKTQSDSAAQLIRLREFIDGLVAERERRIAAGEVVGMPRLQAQIADLRADLHERIQEDFSTNVEQQLGLAQPLEEETIALEAVDADGNVVEVPYTTTVRPLRSLTEARVQHGAKSLMDSGSLALDLYEAVPEPIIVDERLPFRRHYTGEHAKAIAMEARLVVELKGGEWAEPPTGGKVANAIAIRGLDLDRGLSENTNLHYDDSLFVVIEYSDDTAEVYEYRMTTESSSSKKGVGRLQSRQVTYVRGLHRGKDPAYRLVGNRARGTRAGLEGEHDITGANIHSAYSRRPITSDSPLAENVSLGCQVVAASKSDFESSMVRTLDKKGVKRFLYTIVGNDEVDVFRKLVEDGGKNSVIVSGLPRPGA